MTRPLRPLATVAVAVAVAAAAVALAGCGGSGGDAARGGPGSGDPSADDGTAPVEGQITVAAAASLTDAFDRIAADFSKANPGVEVTFDYDSSSALAGRIRQGAPADVFASADAADMAELDAADFLSSSPRPFATNTLVIVTKRGNPKEVGSLSDFADVGTVSLCAEEAPCGDYAARVLAKVGVNIPEANVTRGQNATAALTAVTEGDADAGIVYATDAARATGSVEVVAIPAEDNVTATYPIAVLTPTLHRDVADAFVAWVLGPGQGALRDAGFSAPP